MQWHFFDCDLNPRCIVTGNEQTFSLSVSSLEATVLYVGQRTEFEIHFKNGKRDAQFSQTDHGYSLPYFEILIVE
jgi:hypothetical protein